MPKPVTQSCTLISYRAIQPDGSFTSILEIRSFSSGEMSFSAGKWKGCTWVVHRRKKIDITLYPGTLFCLCPPESGFCCRVPGCSHRGRGPFQSPRQTASLLMTRCRQPERPHRTYDVMNIKAPCLSTCFFPINTLSCLSFFIMYVRHIYSI